MSRGRYLEIMNFNYKTGWIIGMVLCSLWLHNNSLAAEPVSKEFRVGGYVVGCQAYTFHRFTAFEAIEKTAIAGGKAIEYYPGQALSPEDKNTKVDVNASDETIAKLKEHARKCGILAVNFGVVNVPNDEAGVRRVFEFAKKLGVRAITVEPSMEQMDLLEKLVKEYDIRLGIHNHPKRASEPDYKLWDPAYVLSLVKGRDARMGAAADNGHWTRSGIQPLEALKLLEGRIISCHLKDIVERGNPDSADVPLGQGVSDVKLFLQELRRQKFDGNISIEYERDWENTVFDIAQCIGYIRGFAEAESLSARMRGAVK